MGIVGSGVIEGVGVGVGVNVRLGVSVIVGASLGSELGNPVGMGVLESVGVPLPTLVTGGGVVTGCMILKLQDTIFNAHKIATIDTNALFKSTTPSTKTDKYIVSYFFSNYYP